MQREGERGYCLTSGTQCAAAGLTPSASSGAMQHTAQPIRAKPPPGVPEGWMREGVCDQHAQDMRTDSQWPVGQQRSVSRQRTAARIVARKMFGHAVPPGGRASPHAGARGRHSVAPSRSSSPARSALVRRRLRARSGGRRAGLRVDEYAPQLGFDGRAELAREHA